VQIRLLACIAGGLLGVVVASPINASLGFSPAVAIAVCAALGVAAGYVVSIMVDVFTAKPGNKSAGS